MWFVPRSTEQPLNGATGQWARGVRITVSTDPVAEITAAARRQLEQVILPYWLKHGIDEVHGGFHTCFDNRGRTRTGTDKFTWSQGRFVWLLRARPSSPGPACWTAIPMIFSASPAAVRGSSPIM